jgi:hypothetical protein
MLLLTQVQAVGTLNTRVTLYSIGRGNGKTAKSRQEVNTPLQFK